VTLKVGGLVVAVLVGVAPQVVFANPTPSSSPTSLKDAKARVKELEDKAAAIEEDYEEAKLRLAKTERRVRLLRQDVAAQQKKVEQVCDQARVVALLRFQGRSLDTTAQLFIAPDPDAFLGQLSTASKIDENMNAQLQELQAQYGKLSDLERILEAELESLRVEKKQLADMERQLESQLQEAKGVVDKMTAAERAALDSSDGASVSFDIDEIGDANERVKKVIQYAVGHVSGSQYVLGSAGPSSFDCSGFTLASYRQAGVALPHSSRAQYGVGRPVSRGELKPGDLVFWYSPIHHVGLYIGNGKIAHARNPRSDLVIQTLSSYPAPWTGARRIFG
jgi:cell wall-associated NlpC family hydrolase